MDQNRIQDWREICEAAATELDPAKLMHLIAELTRALDDRDKNKKRKTLTGNNNDETPSCKVNPQFEESSAA